MTALSFKKDFAPYILSGRKPHTIRAPRRRTWQPGEALQLYTGMRTKACAKMGDATLLGVLKIEIDGLNKTIHATGWHGAEAYEGPGRKVTIEPPYRLGELTAAERHRLAWADGFDTLEDLLAFFTQGGGCDFEGHLLYWGNSFQAAS